MTRRPDTPENEHERIQPTKGTQEDIENKAPGIYVRKNRKMPARIRPPRDDFANRTGSRVSGEHDIRIKRKRNFVALSVYAYIEAQLQDYPVAVELYGSALAVQDSPVIPWRNCRSSTG